MIGYLCVALLVTTAVGPVTATPLTGSPLHGELVAVSSTTVTLLVDGQPQVLPSAQLQRVDLAPTSAADADPAAPRIIVELVDGTRLRATNYTVQQSQATVSLGEQKLDVPTRIIRSVLLRDQGNNDALRTQWREFVEEKHERDVVVFRREIDGNLTLDLFDGVLYEVTANEVEFALDGDDERQPLKRERVEGLIYFHTASADTPPATLCRVVGRDGSSWHASQLVLEGPQLNITTPAGVKVQLPVAGIQTLDYATGNLVYLSELEWENVEQSLQLGKLSAIPALQQFYQPRRDMSFDHQPLRLGGQTYSRGLALCSRTTVSYRLGEEWGRLRAVVGMDDRVRDGDIPSGVVLTIVGDDKPLLERAVNVEDAPLELDLDIQGIRRLTITVDYGRDGDVADHLNLCDARLTK